jgi:hypothetical protein
LHRRPRDREAASHAQQFADRPAAFWIQRFVDPQAVPARARDGEQTGPTRFELACVRTLFNACMKLFSFVIDRHFSIAASHATRRAKNIGRAQCTGPLQGVRAAIDCQ